MSISNLPAYNVYSYLCSQEHVVVYDKRAGTVVSPTVCKNDGAAISNVSIYRRIIKNNGPLLSLNGATVSSISPNYIDYNSQFYNVSDFGSGTSKVLLKVNDNINASDYLWSSKQVNNYVGSSVAIVNNTITASQYKVGVTSSDTVPGYLSSSLVTSANIGFNILNTGSDQQMQPYVATNDGTVGSNVIWSSQYINSLISSSAETFRIKVTASDTVPGYLSSSLVTSANIGYNILNTGSDQQMQPYVATNDGALGTNVIWSSQQIANYVSSSQFSAYNFQFSSTDTQTTINTVINTFSAIIPSCVFTPAAAGTYLAMFEGVFTYPVTTTGRNQVSFFNSNVQVFRAIRRWIDTQDTDISMFSIIPVNLGGNIDVRWISGSAAQTLSVAGRSFTMIRLA